MQEIIINNVKLSMIKEKEPQGGELAVIMPVYNTKLFLEDAIESILIQKNLKFDLIIIDDGSIDGSYEIACHYAAKHENVFLYRHDENQGIIKTRNELLELAINYEFIALMDSDDISIPNRLSVQLDMLKKNLHLGAVSSEIKIIPFGTFSSYAQYNSYLREKMLFSNVFNNPASMIRTSSLEAFQLRYDEKLSSAEDYDMWLNMLQYIDITIIPSTLLEYRRHALQETTSNIIRQKNSRNQIALKYLHNIDEELTLSDVEFLMEPKKILNLQNFNKLLNLYQKLIKKNKLNKVYSSRGLEFALKDIIAVAIKNDFTLKKFFIVLPILKIRDIFRKHSLFEVMMEGIFNKKADFQYTPLQNAKILLQTIESLKVSSIILYGAGEISEMLIRESKQIKKFPKIEAIIDIKAETSSYYFGEFLVRSPKEIKFLNSHVIVVGSSAFLETIIFGLKENLGDKFTKYTFVTVREIKT